MKGGFGLFYNIEHRLFMRGGYIVSLAEFWKESGIRFFAMQYLPKQI